MRTITLTEEKMTRFPQSTFSESETLALLRSSRFEFDPANAFNGFTHGLRSRGWVGQIPIGDELLIAVAPKVPVPNIFRMLEVAYDLKSFGLFDGDAAVATLDDIYERIVAILCRRVLNRARRGLHRSYVEAQDELPYVRGVIAPLAMAINRERGRAAIPCFFEEQTADIADNQILYFTLMRVARPSLQLPEVQADLDRARRALAGTVSYQEYSGQDCIRRFYHRLNHDYRPTHGLCRFILEQTGPSLEVGEHTFVPFELNMPRLFESYVAQWLVEKLPAAYNATPKYTARVEANFTMNIEVDIVVWDSQSHTPLLVLDTKYKTHQLPSEADLYQLAFYARELGVARAGLVYPMSPPRLAWARSRGIEMRSLVFDISGDLKASGAAFLAAIRNFLDTSVPISS